MRRLHLRGVAVLALLALTLAGCGDQAEDNPGPTDPTITSSADVAPTTAEDATDETVTETPTGGDTDPTTDPEVTDRATDTAVPTTDEPTVTDEAPAPTETAAPPAVPPHGECTNDSLSNDILGFTGGVTVDFCDDGWAFAVYPGAPDTPEFVAQRSEGRWFHAVTLGDPVCAGDLAARGAPDSIAGLLPPCGEPGPTTAPPSPTDPAQPCTVATAQYGSTTAELVGVSCGEATAEWQVAEANGEPSWTIPVTTPSGWECYITPYDATSAAAGSCYAPNGSSFFTLYP